MSKFDMNKIGKRIEQNKVEIGKSYLNEESLKLRDTRKKTEFINLDQIVPNPDNKLSMERVPWLMQDIVMNGLLQPLVVAQMDDGKYMLYAGHQRFEAIRKLHEAGKYGDTVEVKVADLDNLNLPKEVSLKVRKKLLLRSANIQRGNAYATDADRYVVINDWKEIYEELRRCGVEVLEYGLEVEGESHNQQIKGVKTRELVSQQVGISPAQVEKFDRVDHRGTEELKEDLKADNINVVTAAEVASMKPEEQEKILQKIKETKEITPENKISGEDVKKAKAALSLESKTSRKKEQLYASPTMVSRKRINADLKDTFKTIKDAGEEIKLDNEAFLEYLKHIQAIGEIVKEAVNKK